MSTFISARLTLNKVKIIALMIEFQGTRNELVEAFLFRSLGTTTICPFISSGVIATGFISVNGIQPNLSPLGAILFEVLLAIIQI